MKSLLFTFLILGLWGGCTPKAKSYDFEATTAVKLDESKVVLTTYPSLLVELDDSTVAALNSYKTISLYDCRTGSNTANFRTEKINFDSLIRCTYQAKYEGKRSYKYNHLTSGLSDEGGQVKYFQYSDETFYIQVSAMAKVSHTKDRGVKSINEQNEIAALKQKYGAINISTIEYINFLFVTDRDFNVKEIIPLYESENLTSQNFTPIYDRGFLVDDGKIYVSLLKNDEAYTTMRSWKQKQEKYIARIDLREEESADCFLSSKDIDFDFFTIHDYLASPFKFIRSGRRIQFTNGKDLCDVNSEEKVFSKTNLTQNESILSVHAGRDGRLTMITFLTDRKKHPTEFDLQYAIDSLHSQRIRVFDQNTTTWIAEKELPDPFHYSFHVTSSKIYFVEKDTEHYWLKYITYNEK